MQNNGTLSGNLLTFICSPQENLSEAEREQLSNFIGAEKLDQVPFDRSMLEVLERAGKNKEAQWNKLSAEIEQEKREEAKSARKGRSKAPVVRRWIISAAAVIVLFISIVAIKYLLRKPVADDKPQKILFTGDVPPGSSRALLLLGDNSPIELSKMAVGNIANEEGTAIKKLDSTQIIYEMSDREVGRRPVTNNLITPRAGVFKATLPDKTIMRLNAESSVIYPVAFQGARREVYVAKGEVFFEVAHDDRPFIVHFGGQEIEVLGTTFNINTYSNNNQETTVTTLVQGSIRITRGDRYWSLKPDEQAVFAANTNRMEILTKVNAAGAVAWTDGYFNSDGLSFRQIMDELERWYAIRIDIDPEAVQLLTPDPITFTKIPRNITLTTFLTKLQRGCKFQYEFVTPTTVKIKPDK